jgi:hypothetical protein
MNTVNYNNLSTNACCELLQIMHWNTKKFEIKKKYLKNAEERVKAFQKLSLCKENALKIADITNLL